MSRAGEEARRRRKARARKAEAAASAAATPVVALRPRWPEVEALPDGTLLDDCPDPANHMVCPRTGDNHDWCKPHPRPHDHKYECVGCGHYDLDDYR